MNGWKVVFALIAVALLAVPARAQQEGADREKVTEAMSAAPQELAAGATIVDWEGNVLREGTNDYVCYPTPPGFDGIAPMCLDPAWNKLAKAWQSKSEVTIDEVGFGYMLGGDTGASNTDPYATDPDAVEDWVDANEHIMMVVPDPAAYDALPTDPTYGGPWVMWKGTPYAHIMIPTGEVEFDGEGEVEVEVEDEGEAEN